MNERKNVHAKTYLNLHCPCYSNQALDYCVGLIIRRSRIQMWSHVLELKQDKLHIKTMKCAMLSHAVGNLLSSLLSSSKPALSPHYTTMHIPTIILDWATFLGCSCYSWIPWLLPIYHFYSVPIPSARFSSLLYFCHLLNDWDPCWGAGRARCYTYMWRPSQLTCYKGSPLIRSPDRSDLKAPVKVAELPYSPLNPTAALQLTSPTVCHCCLQVLLWLWTSTVISEKVESS